MEKDDVILFLNQQTGEIRIGGREIAPTILHNVEEEIVVTRSLPVSAWAGRGETEYQPVTYRVWRRISDAVHDNTFYHLPTYVGLGHYALITEFGKKSPLQFPNPLDGRKRGVAAR